MSDLEQVGAGIRIAATNGLIRQIKLTRKQAERTFDRWLNAERARIWDEGHGTVCDEWSVDAMCETYHPNPYRKATT